MTPLMDDDAFFGILQEGLWTAVAVSTPILGAALAVGLAIGLVQALTSVQEMTLTFVPKMVAILAVFWASMGYMTLTLSRLFEGSLIPMMMGV